MSAKILLVQTAPSSRKAMAECLRREGFEVDEAVDGEGVIWKLFQERKHIDLLIYDFDLPQVDRIKAAVALRLTQAMTPIIVLTEFPSITADRALFHGTVDFLQKPFSDGELVALCRRLVPRLCRRTSQSQTWHLCVNCKDWPISDYEEQQLTPALELELCNECRLNIQQGICL
jgi:DNA-binding response OmpR family regulator